MSHSLFGTFTELQIILSSKTSAYWYPEIKLNPKTDGHSNLINLFICKIFGGQHNNKFFFFNNNNRLQCLSFLSLDQSHLGYDNIPPPFFKSVKKGGEPTAPKHTDFHAVCISNTRAEPSVSTARNSGGRQAATSRGAAQGGRERHQHRALYLQLRESRRNLHHLNFKKGSFVGPTLWGFKVFKGSTSQSLVQSLVTIIKS